MAHRIRGPHPRLTKIPANYHRRIHALRRRLGMTQEQFAQAIAVSFASVNRWEAGHNKPQHAAWLRILQLANGKSPMQPVQESPIRFFAEQDDTMIRIDLTAIVSYRILKRSDFTDEPSGLVFDLDTWGTEDYEDFTILFMQGGHRHVVRCRVSEFDEIFGVETD